MDGFVAGIVEPGRAVGLYFGAAFLGIILIWVQFLVRWRDEKRELGMSSEGLARLLNDLERPEGVLHNALFDRFQGRACDAFTDREAFEAWFREYARGVRARQAGLLFRDYVWGVLNTARARLRAVDNRVSLTGVRNQLKGYRYHRWLNLGLANTAVSLGILGTVTGLWSGFDRIDFGGDNIAGTMEEVMNALAQALYTTAVGVLVSMPIVISGLKMEQQLEELFGMVHEVHNAVLSTLRQFELEESTHGV